MKNILILGANGRIARLVEARLLGQPDVHLTLVLRHADRLTISDTHRVTVVEGDVSDRHLLDQVMPKQDVVYANLAGNMAKLAENVVQAMLAKQINHLIWVTGSGLYHETPEPFGSWVERMVGHAAKEDTRVAARIIETSALQYTIIRAAYMTDEPQIDYELTQKGTKFKGTQVTRASVADLVLHIINEPGAYAGRSLGISQPGTDGQLPSVN